MATNISYDTDKRIIYVTTSPVNGELTLDVKVDIYSDMKEDWQSNDALNKLKFPLSEPVGGNLTKPPTRISPYYFLKYGWTMRPQESDHTLYLENGYLLVAGGGDPWVKTIGGYTVNIRDVVPTDSFTTPSEGGGTITEEDMDAIVAKVWNAIMANYLTPGSTGAKLNEDASITEQDKDDIANKSSVTVWNKVLP